MCDACGPGSSGLTRRRLLGLLAAAPLGAALSSRSSQAPVEPIVPVEPSPGLFVLPRAAWAEGREPVGPLADEEARFLLVHHTASSNDVESMDDVARVLRQTFDFHTGPERGWPDVCYNFFVDRAGRVWEGRHGSLAGPVRADATGGSQGFAQLACLVGDFTAEMPTEAALESLTRLLAWLADRDGIDTAPGATVDIVSRGSNRWPAGALVRAATISGHRDMSATACPGETFYPYLMAEMPQRVSRHRAAVAAPASTVTPTVTQTVATTVTPTVTGVRRPSPSAGASGTARVPGRAVSLAPDARRGGTSREGWFAVGGALALAVGAAVWARRPNRMSTRGVAPDQIGRVAGNDRSDGERGSGMPEIERSDEQWRELLTPERFAVLRRGGTEPPWSGEYVHAHSDGTYRCAACGAELFDSDTKFESGSGWPSFYRPKSDDAVELVEDRSHGMVRTEVRCRRCGSHLGHVFPDGPLPTGQRYCMNSLALDLHTEER